MAQANSTGKSAKPWWPPKRAIPGLAKLILTGRQRDSSLQFTYQQLEQAISAPRAQRYLIAAHGDPTCAVELYEHNSTLSAAAWVTISDIEVVLRNTIADSVRSLHDAQGRGANMRWYDDPTWFTGSNQWFSQETTDQIKKAARKVKDKGPTAATRPNEGRLIAELTFGFWRYIIISRYEHSLWNPAIRARFPGLVHLAGSDSRKLVNQRMEALNALRNRIAHHEPVFDTISIPGGNARKLTLVQILDDGIELIEWANPDAAAWIRSRSTHTMVFAQRP